MEPLVSGDLRIESHIGSTCHRFDWQGRSNARDPGSILSPYFQQIFAAAADQGATIEMHFEDLEHFNSSTIGALIVAIQIARTRKVRLVLIYRGSLKWQRLSFDALRIFASDELLQLCAV